MLASSTSAAAVGGGAKLAERLLKMAARAANSSNSSSSSSSSSTRSNGDSSSRASWRKVPVPVPDTTPWETPAAAAAAAAGDDSRSEAEEDADASRLWLPCSDDEEDEACGAAADGGCLRYHVVEWLSALLVLLRMAPLRRKGLQEAAALQELHYSVLQVRLWVTMCTYLVVCHKQVMLQAMSLLVGRLGCTHSRLVRGWIGKCLACHLHILQSSLTEMYA
jgi:hypothetical protein